MKTDVRRKNYYLDQRKIQKAKQKLGAPERWTPSDPS